jgi:hypothetical protein
MDPFAFGLAALATWRLAHFLHAEAGPWRAMAWLRGRGAIRRLGVFDCFFCVSVWAAPPAAALIAADGRQALLAWGALSAAAILIQRAAFPGELDPPPDYAED